jgi:gluconolactonase
MKMQLAFLCSALLSGVSITVHAQETTTPEISGVVKAGTPVHLVKDGFEAVEGPVRMSDDSLLFTNNKTEQIVHIMSDGSTSIWFDHTGGANALTWTSKGEMAATLNVSIGIAVMKPGEPPRILVSEFEGKKFNRPNDLIASKRGQIYFTDTAAFGVVNPALPSAVYQLSEKGQLQRIATDIARPNGVALSPDEHTLYVANTVGEWIVAFELDRKGNVKAHRDFAKLALPPAKGNVAATSGADGIAIDEKGRLYVATAVGVQVISPKGESLGVIAMPKQPQNLAFAGKNRSSLYVVGRGAVYRIDTLTHGPHRAGK